MSRLLFGMGMALRETGMALDRVGSRLQGRYGFTEMLSRHVPVMSLPNKVPEVGAAGFIAPSASVIGDAKVGEGSSVWYGAVVRADVNAVAIGAGTNVQDRAVIHVAQHGLANPAPTIIGDRVTIGHAAVIHAATIEDEALVGIAAVVLDGVKVAKHAIVAAGSLVAPGTEIASGELWAGTPAKKVRTLTDKEVEGILRSAEAYQELARVHAIENSKSFAELQAEQLRRELREDRSEDYSSHTGTLGKEEEIVERQARLAEAERYR